VSLLTIGAVAMPFCFLIQLFAAPRQMRQSDEDQILKRFADGEQVDARHAPKNSPTLG
jgi:hypothetical protein